jgi:hypothetical protein
MEVADEYPSVAVKGVDLSPIQPVAVPINVDFIVDDLNDELDFNDGSMDLVQSRYTPQNITVDTESCMRGYGKTDGPRISKISFAFASQCRVGHK